MSDEIRLELEGPLARITIDHPPLNILSNALLERLASAFEAASSSDEVRLIRLDAQGKVFSAGVEVADHLGDKVQTMMHLLARLFETLERIRVPTVSVVHGAALGGGCELTLATDLCFASDRASFGQPEIRLGLFAPPASVLLPRIVGERRALALLLSGETIPAAEAERIGLVNRVFPADRLETEVESILERLLQLSRTALCQAKQAVKAARRLDLVAAHREVNRLYLEELMQTEDAHEGLKAFMEKRKASWKHA